MKNFLLVAASLLLLACGTDQQVTHEQNAMSNLTALTKDYLLAYNVYVPDSLNDNNYEVFSMELDGQNPANLTQHPDVAWTYLAVDDKILFISDRDTCYRCFFLYEMNWDGSDMKQITDFTLKDSWMSSRAQGSEIIVRPAEDSVFYIINRTGDILHRVPPGKVYFNDPCFSPDGQQIVFRGADYAFKKDNGYIDELYIMQSDGSNIRQLTHYPADDTTAKWHNYHAGPPRWHPTENFISYQSKQGGKSSLFGVNPDGKKQWKLTDLTDNEGWHAWSKDGKLCAIETYDLQQKQFHITLLDWENKVHETITDTLYRFQQAPVFVRKPKK